jgi:hypothetical protein
MERTRKVSGARAVAKARREVRGAASRGGADDAGGDGAKGPRYREDGFTPEKRRVFLAELAARGCVRDAAAIAGVSDNTVRRHRRLWKAFDGECKAARQAARKPLEDLAWERATKGGTQKIIRNGIVVEERVKPSDAMLRLLLQGADPDKYGRPGGHVSEAKVARLKAELREEVVRKIEEEGAAESEARVRSILLKIAQSLRRDVRNKGWQVMASGRMVPPGYGPVAPDGEPLMEDPLSTDWSSDRETEAFMRETREARERGE